MDNFMTGIMWTFNAGDCSIDMTSSAGFTVWC